MVGLPKQQPYPASKIKVGAVLFSAEAYTDDQGRTSTTVSEWVIRSIQAKRGSKTKLGVAVPGAEAPPVFVNLTKKVDFLTWGKRSSKSGDYGWLSSIPAECQAQFAVGGDLPRRIYTTKRAAVLFAIADTEERIQWYQGTIGKETDPAELSELKADLAECEAELAALKRRLKSQK